MKHIFILMFFIVVYATALGQNADSQNRVDSKNLKQGYWCKYYPNGQKAYEGWFKDNKPVGEFKRYHENGELKILMIYSEPSAYIPTTFFDSNGKKMVSGFYKNQQKDSLWLYYSPNGNLIFEERYREGVKHGRTKSYYPSGKILESATYVNGLLNGVLIQFFENGLNKTIVPYSKGEIDGTMKVFYPNATLRTEGSYKHGLKHGEWRFYDAYGNMLQAIRYTDGVAENSGELIEKESNYMDSLIKNAGKLKEPSIDEIVNSRGIR